MTILAIRTDKPEAELYLYEGEILLAKEIWLAHRALAETLLSKIEALLKANGKSYEDLAGVACFEGPGSFTGLRIGITVANTLSYSMDLPIMGGQGENWHTESIAALLAGDDKRQITPFYGADVHITPARK